MDKIDRNYLLRVQNSIGAFVEIEPPFTLEFDILRNDFSSANTASMRIYNLSKATRSSLRKDQWIYDVTRLIQLRAGYGNNLSTVFDGNVSQAWSVREYNNIVTEIQSFDGGGCFNNSNFATPFNSGTPNKAIITAMASSLSSNGVQLGAIGNFPGKLTRGNAFSGPTTDLLRSMTGNGFFIDNGKVNCLNDDEAIAGPIFQIDASSGLLGTPTRENSYVNFEMIFEPRLVIGQLLKIKSTVDSDFTEVYRVKSLHHKGVISEAYCGTAITSVGLVSGQQFTEVYQG